MNTSRFHPPSRSREKGVALVIVLGLLVLVLILVIAFFSSVSVELQSAKRYSSGADARALADSAVSVVISQIQDATAAPQLAWASQPGMIRTYDNTGNAVMSYKLYSSSSLRVGGNFNAIANQGTEVPGSWVTDTMLYTDLNKPVAVAGSNHYPIIDPGAVAANTSGGAALSGTSPAIEGCFIDTSNSAVATSGSQTNPVPMPVQWMYVLKNGALAAMNPATKKVANATPGNPIVGRVAFWTDDETSKVNINTASEGTFWDRPWASSDPATGFDAKLAQTIPAQNEFQRFPGHPAMTCLSTVFPSFTGETEAQYNKRLYDIIPRITDGGSKSATTTVNYLSLPIVNDNDRLFASVDEFMFSATAVLSGTRQPNYSGASTTFTADTIEKTRFFLTANSRSPEVNMFNKPRVTLWPLQINPDPGTGKATQNAKDKLIAFCSTIGSGANAKPYYFQRYSTFDYSKNGPNDRTGNYNPSQNPRPSSQSTIMDWSMIPRNQDLYAYLQSLTSTDIPGLGGRLGGNTGKYSLTNRDQILTEMFDYLRSNINIMSAGISTTSGTTGYSYAPFSPTTGAWTGQFQIVPLVLPNNTKGFGQFPTITQAALIFYRTDNFIVSGTEQTTGSQSYPTLPTITSGTAPRMAAFLVLQPFTPTPGPPPWSANLRIKIEGLENFSVTTGTDGTFSPMGFPSSSANLVTARDAECNATALTGLELFTQYWPLNIKKPGQPQVGAADEEQYYPFISNSMPVGPSTFNFKGGTIKIKLYSAYSKSLDESDLVQTINMTFPDGSGWPTPTPAYSISGTGPYTVNQYNTVPNRFGALQNGAPGIQLAYAHNPLPLIVAPTGTTGDTVRANETRYGGPALGDYRMIAGQFDVPDSYFEGHGMKDSSASPGDGKKYSDTAPANRQIHSLRVDSDSPQQQSGGSNGYYVNSGRPHGKLISSANYYDPTSGTQKSGKPPVVTRGLVQANMANGAPGDWDTGVGNRPDGPFINKADQGNVGSNAAVTGGYYSAVGLDGSANNVVLLDSGATFSPNRQVSSAVIFGSLPSGIDPATPQVLKPWQTLLFCKNPLAGPLHPGFGVAASGSSGPPYSIPPDHAFLDLFTMPIVEPYAISEPFSTAGKVNMNYQIVPFTYLTRDTAVRAVLKSTRVMAIPTVYAINYKYGNGSGQTGGSYPPDFRYTINPDETVGTLKGFQNRFSAGDIFRSASEICDIYLVPKYLVNTTNPAPLNPTYDTMNTWWNTFQLTGDNIREGPYGHIYPRFTTKSNTYTVHVQSQSISKSSNTPADQFVDGQDQVTGEFRGSFLIERYLDPNSDSLVKADGKTPASELDSDAMVGPYKFRVISTKRFAP